MPDLADNYAFLEPPAGEGELGTLAHYRVQSELGRGGMGYVFQAEDSKLKRSVALKVMNQKVAAIPGSRKRFISEARAMAAVHHDNVATIFEVGESRGTPFMAMEMLTGDTLEEFNKTHRHEPLGYEQIIEFATQIARGLAAAHARGIVHRDIKPANIWVEPTRNRIKILDFGLALASTPVDQLAGRGAVIGTPGYLSPEQARSDPLDDRSDLYSLGVVLYELCTGRLPIQSKTVPEQLISILAHRPTPIGELNPDIPKPLCDLIHRLIRKEPRTRFDSALQLEQELAEVEEACHKQSEVAQAISRLKLGLNQVATPAGGFGENDSINDHGPAFDSLGDLPAVAVDPLANLPATPAVNAGATSGAMRVPAAGMSRSDAVAKKPSTETTVPAWQPYLPLIAIVLLGLLALPLMTFAFTGFGRSSEPFVVDPSAADETGDSPSPVETDEPQADDSQPRSQDNSINDQASSLRQGFAASDSNAPSADKTEAAGKESNASLSASEQAMDELPIIQPQLETNEMATVAKPAVTQPEMSAATPANDRRSPTDAVTESSARVKIPMKVISISTAQGRGADAMVQIGPGGGKQGTKTSLGIRARDGIELNHTYLRFDLKGWQERLKQAEDARLTLFVVGGKTPQGARLRLIGIENVGIWPESRLDWRNSPSYEKASRPLDSFPVLLDASLSLSGADSENGGQDVARVMGEGKIQIGGPTLARFLQAADETVTLAVAGSWDDRLLRFVSRERSSSQAPMLQVLVPESAALED